MEKTATIHTHITEKFIDQQDTQKNKRVYECLKRIFDFLSSLLVSIVIFLPCVLIAVFIMIADPGSPFYMHERVGKNGEKIKILKFRSMVKDEVDLKTVLTPEQYEQYQTEYKIDNDPRLIPYGIGSFIRKTSIDELPQIFYNICMKGNMSVIGPRPVIESELYEKYTEPEQKKLVSVKPGLTGYWQAYARNNAGYESGKRQEMELYYVDNRSAWLDIKILFKSVIAVLTRSGAQ